MNRLHALCGALLLLSGTSSAADITRFGRALTHVWDTHPEVLQAQAAATAAGFDVTSAYSGFLPYAQIDASTSRKVDTAVARFILPLYSGGSTLAAIDGAQAAAEQAQADVNRARLRLGLRLNDAWFAWVAAVEQDALWRDYLRQLADLTHIIQRRAEEGVSPPSDVINILTRQRQAEAQAEQNRSVINTSRAQLQALLGTEVGARGEWPSRGEILPDSATAQALARVSDLHPELKAARAAIARSDADRRANRGRIIPELVLRHVQPLGNPTVVTPPENTELALIYQSDSGFRAFQAMRASASRTEGAKAALDTTRREVEAAIRAAAAERAALRLQLGFQREAADSAGNLIEGFVRQFKVGRKTWLEVLNALREANDTRLQYLQQRRSFWVANQRLALQGLFWDVLVRESAASADSDATPRKPAFDADSLKVTP